MATSSSVNDITIKYDEMLISLKAIAHLRSHDHHHDIVGAGAGIIENLGKTVEDYEPENDVVVFMQGTSQGHEISRFKAHTSHVCLKPPHMGYEDAVSMVYPFVTGLTILQTRLGISFPSPSIASTVPTALILGGEHALGDALTQLLHLALPGTSILDSASELNLSWTDLQIPCLSRDFASLPHLAAWPDTSKSRLALESLSPS